MMSRDKFVEIKELLERVSQFRDKGNKIVVTNGCFDILHSAHLRVLEKAKSLGDILIVLINSDKSVRRYKGDKRPILSESERAEMLSCLPWVDYVCVFDKDTPLEYVRKIKPDFFVKGGAFDEDRLKPEIKLMEEIEGTLETFPLEEGYSTTNVIQRVLDAYGIDSQGKYECPKDRGEIFDRSRLRTKPLKLKNAKSSIDIMIDPESDSPNMSSDEIVGVRALADDILEAKKGKRPVIFAFGAHLVKNGLSLVLVDLMEKGFINHIVTNGAVAIHDWEFAYAGETEEDVRENITNGEFGLWEETGKYMNLAVTENQGQGYGKAIGKFVSTGKLRSEDVNHKHKDRSIFSRAYELGVRASVCPGIGYDIIFEHPACSGSAVGNASYIDFLKLAHTLCDLEGGVYVSIGSAVASPMLFEKALNMAKNTTIQEKKKLEDYSIVVNDIQPYAEGWVGKREPQKSSHGYYLRYIKTFSRMGGKFKYIQMDNRVFLQNLHKLLNERK